MALAENRKPLIILGIIGVVVILVYVTGAIGARHENVQGGGWQERLTGFDPASELRAGDLVPIGSGCEIGDSSIVVTGMCSLTVRPVDGRFTLSRVTRAALLSSSAGVHLVVNVAGQQIEKDVGSEHPVRVTFGKDGGTLQVACLTPLTPACVVSLAKEDA